MSWWDAFVWGYATDIEEIEDDQQEVTIDITINIGD